MTAGDQIIAQSLHRAGKTVILAANKCESRAGDAGVGEAYSLGFGEPIAISAEHRMGFPELRARAVGIHRADHAGTTSR